MAKGSQPFAGVRGVPEKLLLLLLLAACDGKQKPEDQLGLRPKPQVKGATLDNPA